MTLRVLRAIRLSVLTDETTSPGRQRASVGVETDRRGGVIIGEAEDLDVSASKTSPFERPELGAWLKRPDEYDAIMWWRFDRAIRSMADMYELGRWARDHAKLLIFVEGPGGAPLELDMRTISPVSELIMIMLAFASQMESMAIQERVKGAMATLRAHGRYAGGLPPYGYMKVKNPNGEGWKLAPDPEVVPVLEQMIADILKGKSLTEVAVRLNENGVPVPRDYAKIKQGKPTGGIRHGQHHARFRWSSGTLSKVLRSPALMGYRIHNGRPVRDLEGKPVLIGDPVLERQEFEVLQNTLDSRTPRHSRTRRDTQALLLGVAKCAGCQGNMYLSVRTGGRDYNCRASSRGERCPSPSGIRADWLEAYVIEQFLTGVGHLPITRLIEHKGYDPLPELRKVEAELRALYAEKDARRSATGRLIWQEEVDALERRAEALESTPRTDSRTEVVKTGETYAAYWTRHDAQGRRQLLVDAGAQVTVSKGRSGGDASRLDGPDMTRLKFALGRHADPEAEALDAIMREELED